jgi:FkbM family methyltransferase
MAATRILRPIFKHRYVEPLVSIGLLARLVRHPARFALAQGVGRGRLVAHTLRDGGLVVMLEHGTPDVYAFDEIFYRRIYDPPAEVDAALASLGTSPAIVDIGANIGLFGAWALRRWPDAAIDAFEPDPRNAAVHRRTIAANERASTWRLHEAAAATQDGTMPFLTGRFVTSRPAAEADAGATDVPARDVLPLLARADLVKIDAEGSEWAILDDRRFAETAARVVALEYHPDLCPESDTRAAAAGRLEAAGFRVRDVPTASPAGYGSLWAWRGPG